MAQLNGAAGAFGTGKEGLPNGIAATAWRGHVGCRGRPAGLQRKRRNPLTSDVRGISDSQDVDIPVSQIVDFPHDSPIGKHRSVPLLNSGGFMNMPE